MNYLIPFAVVAALSGSAQAADGTVVRIHRGQDCYKFTMLYHIPDANGNLIPQEEVYGILDTDPLASDLKDEIREAYWHKGYISIQETPARQCGSAFVSGVIGTWAPADYRYGEVVPGAQP